MPNKLWQIKFNVTLFLVLLSVYLLLPTFLGLKEKREAIKAGGFATPWYYKLLAADELNLGLDLRGGVYLEMEVEIDEALDHQVGFLVGDVKRFVLTDDLKDIPVEKISSRALRVEVPTAKRNTLIAALGKSFDASVLSLMARENELFYAIKGDAEAARRKVLEALANAVGGVPPVSLTNGGKFIAVGYRDDLQKTAAMENLSDPVYAADFTPAENPDVAYLRVGDDYLAKLRKDIIEQAANAVRNRIDRYGVAEASVSRSGGERLVVELPGAKNPDQLIGIVRRTGKLEFRLEDENLSTGELRTKVDGKLEELKLGEPYEGEALKKLNAALRSELPENAEILFSLTRDSVTKKVTGSQPYLVTKTADVTGDMLDNAKVETQNNQPYVSMSFNKAGAKAFGELTEKNVGKKLAIVLDDVVMSAPVIRSAILGGEAQIELGLGRYDTLLKEAQELVLILREGALPASLKIASKNVIGPSLGRDSITAGINSVGVSSLLVILFMLAYYRLSGLVANVALALNVLFLAAILCLFQASVTLPGLAGIALTIGMAVDANVIIFERMREERHLGHDMRETVDGGYGNAMSAIIDGNITTFIAGMVLYEFGTGPIKGFATTLMIGIATTLFTAVIVTRLALDFLAHRGVKRIGV